MTPDRRTIVFIALGHLIDHYVILIFPTAVLGMIAAGGGTTAFGLPYGDLVTLSTGLLVAFGIFALPAGGLADRWSRRTLLIIFFIGTGLATALTAFVWNAWSLAIALFLIGVFAAIYHPVGTALLVATTDRLGRDVGRNAVFGNIGVAFAALATGALVDFAGWRAAFVVPGLITFAIGVLFWMSPVPTAAHAGRSKVARFSVGRRAAIIGFILLTLSGAANTIIFNAVTIALPKLLDERLTSVAGSATAIGIVGALVVGVGAIAQIVVGRLVDRFSLFHVALCTAAINGPMLFLASGASGIPLVLALAGLMIALFGQVVVNETMLACYVADSWRGRAYAVRFFVAFGVGTLATILVGQLHERAGFTAVLWVLTALGALVFLCIVALPRPKTPEAEPVAPEALATPAE